MHNPVDKPPERTFAMVLAYDGTRYGGWQRQENSLGVQQIVEEALEKALNVRPRTLASGRTDAGVHALGQIVRFRTRRWKHEASKLVPAINRNFPKDIAVQQVDEMVPTFNPMRDSITKVYRYTLRIARCPDPFDERIAWYMPRRLDLDLLKAAATQVVGKHDFVSFQSLGSPRSSTVRTITRLEVTTAPARYGHYIHLDFEADGFLYNMVRNITGTLVAISTRGMEATTMASILEARDRKHIGQNAPACGLCLMRVNYPASVYLETC
jgi:tRNA pseudouridine38-40 synthase